MRLTLPTFNGATPHGGDYPLVCDGRAEARGRGGEPLPIFLGNRVHYLAMRGDQAIDIAGAAHPLAELLLEPITMEV